MPEFLLFHALSGQGVFTWGQHAEVLRRIPYELVSETAILDAHEPFASGSPESVAVSVLFLGFPELFERHVATVVR